MTCSACSAHVEKAVAKLKGVRKASVNLLTNTMTAEYDENAVDANGIIAAVNKAGYGASLADADGAVPSNRRAAAADVKRGNAQNSTNSMKIRLIVSLVFMVVLMYVAMGHMAGAPLPPFMTGTENAVSFALVQLLLCLPIMYVNRTYYVNGFKRLFSLAPNMDSLIAVGSAASLAYGVFAIFRMSYGLGAGDLALVEKYSHELYFESAGMILALVTVGKYLETLSKRRTGDALEKLRKLVPDKAVLIKDGREVSVDSSTLTAGDTVAVKAGMVVPADAEVIGGSAFMDESAISGESVPVEKGEGDKIVGGTVNRSGYVTARVTAVGGESVIAKIIRLVEDAGADKAPIAKAADKIAGIFVPVVMGIALVTFIGWLAGTKDFETALSCAISVLVISCPCALGLATPVAVMVGTGKGAENGVLIKSGEALEVLHAVKYVVLDKTGTVTEGVPEVSDVMLRGDSSAVLAAVAGIEKQSEHPLGAAVVEYAEARGVKFAPADSFITLAGKGVVAVSGGDSYAVGNAALMRERGVAEEDFAADLAAVTREGKTPLMVARNGRYAGLIATSDKLKPTSAQAVRELKKLGVKIVMLTGDNARTAGAIAREAGIDEVFAEVLPQDKERKIAELQRHGKVAMVGDGINDAPALMRADVGIAVGRGSDIAVDSADVVLVKNDLLDVVTAVRLSRRTMRNIKENLFWAFFYNTLGIPLAAGVLFVPFGIKLNPMIGAAAMSLSSLFVVFNALRLKLFKPTHGDTPEACSCAAIGGELPAVKFSADGDERAVCTVGDENGVSENGVEIQDDNCKGSESSRRSVNMKQFELNIEGMMCGHCTARVEKALKAVDGVESVKVSLADKTAKVEASECVTAERLKAAVEEQDYEVTSIKQ